ncbi:MULTISPECIES: hypothetical protein [unclassified Brevibacillus]|uniref:hypothetical protein n=1 Tax=unclassified Brevibacillus TaxID=2684853 RepID=UPI00156AC1F1|nr:MULTISPECIES: hypothetical protein [unclassified Brevibacillus]MDH6352154.1 hypothetical protein [Brevibacillus sp. 1238]NRQ54513.1 hypothetical protein [Brevibacillus sp. HD1.4A]UED67400.1 hypothetical protein HP435_19140 [Brevibacillus sp. HD3.3A]
MADYGQEVVKIFLSGYGLEVKKIKEGSTKTPDFDVLMHSKRVFYCEEKTLEYDDFEGHKDDPVYNSISAHIHKAAKQFNSINPNHEVPNVLAFTSLDSSKDIHDLIITITGNALLEGGGVLKIRNVGHRLDEDLDVIDLFLWFDQEKFINFVIGRNSKYEQELLKVFNITE